MTEQELNKARNKIAEHIKNKREELGMSQQDLADKTGFRLNTIKNFEAGKFWLNLKDYIVIRDALQLPDIY
jgi:ribosome-binding protein aMBF1 (putative translation factor)